MRSSIMLSDLFLVDTPKKLIFDFLFFHGRIKSFRLKY